MGAKIQDAMEATRITVDEFKERMNRGEQFTILDTRNPKAWGDSKSKLPAALRVTADDLEEHLDEIPRDRAIIAYCT